MAECLCVQHWRGLACCAVDVNFALLGHMVGNNLHCGWQLDAQVKGVEVSDPEPDVLDVPALLTSGHNGCNVQVEPGHVTVLLEAQDGTYPFLVCQSAPCWLSALQLGGSAAGEVAVVAGFSIIPSLQEASWPCVGCLLPDSGTR